MTEVLVEKVYRVITKRKFNRGKPLNSEEIRIRITQSIQRSKSIPFIAFWGVGPKNMHDVHDEKTCAFFQAIHKEVQEIYTPGIEYTFIFADKHGIHNGYEGVDIQSYIESMKELFRFYDYRWVILSDYWDCYNISIKKIERELSTKRSGWWDVVVNKEVMEKNALHCNITHSPREAAMSYYVMRNLEKSMLETEFPESIFHAFSDPKLANVLPNMPTLYLYAREGWSNAPWFTK